MLYEVITPRADIAFRFQFLDALPAWRGRQVNPRGDLLDGQAGILLQQIQYFPVDGISYNFV